MGSGSYNTDTHAATAAFRASTGTSAFDYSDTTTRSVPRASWTVNDRLDPKHKNGAGPFEGKITRESADSDEHPNSLAIGVLFDVTGSMRRVPRDMQTKLPELFGLILRKGYVEHPQILYGAIGDATSDRAPLQVGQFESDNRMDEDLEAILLEGNGGGGARESYELAAYFMARHTHIDCYEKRGKRGYLFIIGDEGFYPSVDRRQVESIIGDDLDQSLSSVEIFEELKAKFDVYIIRPVEGSYNRGTPEGDNIYEQWQKIFGQNVIDLEDASAVCETIALTIGIAEGTIDLDEGLDHLKEVGLTSGDAVGKALATIGATAKGGLATGDSPADLSGESVDRL